MWLNYSIVIETNTLIYERDYKLMCQSVLEKTLVFNWLWSLATKNRRRRHPKLYRDAQWPRPNGQTTFSNAFSWKKMCEFRLRFQWSFFVSKSRINNIPALVQIMAWPGHCLDQWWLVYWRIYSLSQEICTRFCCALLCCGYAIVHNESTWNIYPYSSGLLCWHWGNR